MSVFERLVEKLSAGGVAFHVTKHEPMGKSEEVARMRGVALETGAKAIVLTGSKTKQHYLFVIPANLRMDSKKVKQHVGENTSFASDVEAITGCVPGAVPPFGSVVGLKTYLDPKLGHSEEINFNAGSLTDSIRMRYEDYVRVEQPELVDVTQEQ